MEDILVTKIIEAEKQAEEIILKSEKKANHMLEEYKNQYSLDKKQIEQKYDEMIFSKEESIKNEYDETFNKMVEEMKTQNLKLKDNSESNYEKALNILLSGVVDNGNS